MALAESTEYDKIEVVGEYKAVPVWTTTVKNAWKAKLIADKAS